MCYYVDTSFVYNQSAGEDLCSNKYSNSSLVKLNSHDWGNINATRFLGRIFDDILLEFFYYQLEKKMTIESKNDTNKKHWLRLLVVDKNPQNECILRYFIRSAGAFTILPKCDHGGHPVCQCESIRNNISKIISIDETTASSLEINNKTDLTTTTTLPILSTSTNLSIVSNETSIPNHQPISDEDLNNETNTDYKSDNNTLIQNKSQRPAYRPPLMMITGSLLALAIFSLAIVFLVRYFRRSRGSYTTHSNIVGSSRRKKRSSTATTSIDTSSAPSVLYSRLKSSPPSIIIDTDMSHPFDNSTTIDDNVQLLPQSINQIQLHENLMPEDEEEYLHATLKVHNEK
jgi:hypothetical protein